MGACACVIGHWGLVIGYHPSFSLPRRFCNRNSFNPPPLIPEKTEYER